MSTHDPGQPFGGDPRPDPEWSGPPSLTYVQQHPWAYVERFDFRRGVVDDWFFLLLSGGFFLLWLASAGPGGAGVIGLLILLTMSTSAVVGIWRATRRREVILAVDAPGVLLGAPRFAEPGTPVGLVPWDQVAAVVVYRQLPAAKRSRQRQSWAPGPTLASGPDTLVVGARRAVGIRFRQDPPDAPVYAYRFTARWGFDRAALEAAVARFSPGTPVIHGPDQS